MQFLHDIECNSMIIGKLFGFDQHDSRDFTVGNFCKHIGLMVEISHGRIDPYKICYNPSGVHENSFTDADLSTHIVTKFFMDVN